MARYIIHPEDQIQRINRLKNEVESFQQLDKSVLTKRPKENSWSIIEVVEHMYRGHKDYRKKLDDTNATLSPSKQVITAIKTKALPSFLIKRFPPKEGKIRFKMKTMKRFIPVFENESLSEAEIDSIFDRFYDSLDHLMVSVENYRAKNATEIRFNSAVGGWVRFNVAEACEFILCHNERHLQQMKNAFQKINHRTKTII